MSTHMLLSFAALTVSRSPKERMEYAGCCASNISFARPRVRQENRDCNPYLVVAHDILDQLADSLARNIPADEKEGGVRQ